MRHTWLSLRISATTNIIAHCNFFSWLCPKTFKFIRTEIHHLHNCSRTTLFVERIERSTRRFIFFVCIDLFCCDREFQQSKFQQLGSSISFLISNEPKRVGSIYEVELIHGRFWGALNNEVAHSRNHRQ